MEALQGRDPLHTSTESKTVTDRDTPIYTRTRTQREGETLQNYNIYNNRISEHTSSVRSYLSNLNSHPNVTLSRKVAFMINGLWPTYATRPRRDTYTYMSEVSITTGEKGIVWTM